MVEIKFDGERMLVGVLGGTGSVAFFSLRPECTEAVKSAPPAALSRPFLNEPMQLHRQTVTDDAGQRQEIIKYTSRRFVRFLPMD